MQSLLILGRQPALGIAELESIYGADKLTLAGTKAVIVDVDPCLLAFDRLGGSVKFCKLLTTLDTVEWPKIEKFLVQVSPEKSKDMPEGKMRLGLSLYDLSVPVPVIHSTGLKLKKAIQKTGRSVRYVPNQASDLNSAQVIHNKLTSETGWELVFIKNGSQTIVAQSVKVQDISSYTMRDRGRPKRDPKVGMLPPKLAQIILNLAAGNISEEKLESICDIPANQAVPPPDLGQTVLDPFCGTGVVLQEAMLMGYGVYGTDIDQRMIDYTAENLGWLGGRIQVGNLTKVLEKGDATVCKWGKTFDFVAAEAYLGQPFTSLPDGEALAKAAANCNLIIKKFLTNLAAQTGSGTRLCIAVPAWQIKPGVFKHLPLIDQISDLGYNRLSFKLAEQEDLIYFRSDQVVARKLIVLTRK
jgi:SAM-dependent methyltransferase